MVKAPKAVVVLRLTHAISQGARVHWPGCNRFHIHKITVTPVCDVTERPSTLNLLTPFSSELKSNSLTDGKTFSGF